MVKLADTIDSKSIAEKHVGSSPTTDTNEILDLLVSKHSMNKVMKRRLRQAVVNLFPCTRTRVNYTEIKKEKWYTQMKNVTMSKLELLNPQGILTCPVCGKEFKANEDTKYIATGGYTCSWKCFLTDVNKQEKQKKNKS